MTRDWHCRFSYGLLNLLPWLEVRAALLHGGGLSVKPNVRVIVVCSVSCLQLRSSEHSAGLVSFGKHDDANTTGSATSSRRYSARYLVPHALPFDVVRLRLESLLSAVQLPFE